MPELPEVQTIVSDLNRKVKNLKIVDVWTDWRKMIRPLSLSKNSQQIKRGPYSQFVKELMGRKILRARRRAKYILIDLDKNKTLIIHQKISGHLLYGKWIVKKNKIEPQSPGPIKEDPYNKYIRFILCLNNKMMLGLSDLRRFAKVILIDTDKIDDLEEIKNLGPEPLEKDFTFKKFKQKIINRKGPIKKVLMNQNIIAGIGNIYSDEILFDAKIHPLRKTEGLKDSELKKIYNSIKKILKKAIGLRGDSMQDYRDLSGKKGGFQNFQKVYQRTGQKCFRCKGVVKRIKINNRSAHFCDKCQH